MNRARDGDQRGFSLIEILVALFLIAIMFAVLMGGNVGSRDYLEESVDSIERSLRYASDEAILRNSVIRVRFNLNEIPNDFMVEFGPEGRFVIPKNDLLEKKNLTLSEEEELKERNEKLNQKFNPIQSYKEGHEPLSEEVSIVAIGSAQGKELKVSNWSIYFYPSGEKDDAIIFIAYEDLMATLIVNPFKSTYDREYTEVPEGSEDIIERRFNIAKEKFEEWQKN